MTASPTSSTSIITATPTPTPISAARCAGAVQTARAASTIAATGSQTPRTSSSRMALCALSSLSVRSRGTALSTVGMCAAFS